MVIDGRERVLSVPAADSTREHSREMTAPLYVLAAERIEALVMARELGDLSPLPPEGVLMEKLDVSRGTLRRAMELLAQEGLLKIQAGRGTYVSPSVKVRRLVWRQLAEVARPDSRFHLDLSKFIPDFEGRERADERALTLPFISSASQVLLTPDNSLESLRHALLKRDANLIVPTYDLKRGFVYIEAERVPAEALPLAATLDGMERFGRHLTLDDMADLPPVDAVISGAVAATTRGVHFGSGAGNLDLEWSLLRHLELADDSTPVVVSIHDCQVLDADIRPGTHDVVADVLLTPTRLIACEHDFPKPDGTYWRSARRHSSLAHALDVTDS